MVSHGHQFAFSSLTAGHLFQWRYMVRLFLANIIDMIWYSVSLPWLSNEKDMKMSHVYNSRQRWNKTSSDDFITFLFAMNGRKNDGKVVVPGRSVMGCREIILEWRFKNSSGKADWRRKQRPWNTVTVFWIYKSTIQSQSFAWNKMGLLCM